MSNEVIKTDDIWQTGQCPRPKGWEHYQNSAAGYTIPAEFSAQCAAGFESVCDIIT